MIKSETKKICFFFPSINQGGAEKVPLALSKELISRGYDVDFIIVRENKMELVPEGVRVLHISSYSKRYFRTLLMLPGLFKYLKVEKPCTLISILPRCNLISSILKVFFRNVPIVIVEQNQYSSTIKNNPTIKNKIGLYLSRLLYRLPNRIVSSSEGVGDDLSKILKINREKIVTIYNPIYSEELIQKSRELIKHKWFQEHNKVVLGVGRLVEQKNFSLLIESFSEVYKKDPISRLIILGEGKQRVLLEQKINKLGLSKVVDMPGFVDNPYAYMSRASVFVLSSDWEGFGNVLVEAMACGTPVVSTDCPSGPAEILENGKYGKLVPAGNIDKLARAIVEQLNEDIDTETLISRSKYFSISNITDQYLFLLKN